MTGRWAALVVGLALAVAGCGGGDEGGGAPTPLRARPGDCFDDPAGGAQLTQADLRSCQEPHDNEVFAVVEHPAAGGEPFPGREAVIAYAEQACAEVFADYVGKVYDQSRYSLLPVVPTQTTWDAGDRQVVCALYDHRAGKLSGSARGSGQ